MLITRDILNKALEDKAPLFHDGDYIDDDVLYDLFYAQPILKDLPNEKKALRTLIPKSDRNILCAELKERTKKLKKEFEFEKIYYSAKCKSCGKEFSIYITKSQIIDRRFKISNSTNIHFTNILSRYPDRYYLFRPAFKELYSIKFGNSYNMYVCESCIDKFISDSMRKAADFLERKDKFDWFLSEESLGDWKRELFRIETTYFKLENREKIEDGKKIRAANGDVWKDDKYNEREKREQEERNHLSTAKEVLQYCQRSTAVLSWEYSSTSTEVLEPGEIVEVLITECLAWSALSLYVLLQCEDKFQSSLRHVLGEDGSAMEQHGVLHDGQSQTCTS